MMTTIIILGTSAVCCLAQCVDNNSDALFTEYKTRLRSSNKPLSSSEGENANQMEVDETVNGVEDTKDVFISDEVPTNRSLDILGGSNEPHSSDILDRTEILLEKEGELPSLSKDSVSKFELQSLIGKLLI